MLLFIYIIFKVISSISDHFDGQMIGRKKEIVVWSH